jgi:parallel beta-helix repeat protein
MTRTTTRTVLSLSALALVITGAVLYAGPLDPPAGPVASTYKTLTEVEPRTAINATNTPGDADSLFKITVPGSYYLTGNIDGKAGEHGIEIAVVVAGGVTLDLNGFELLGAPGSLDGVSVTIAGQTNIAVVNGSVRNWGDKGVDLVGSFLSTSCRVEGVRASDNVGHGIDLGAGGTASNCSAFSNGGSGIHTGNGCVVTHCSVSFNSLRGIDATNGCTISNCVASDNSIAGIGTFFGCTVLDCTAYNNGSFGINVNTGGTVTRCATYENTGIGINGNFGVTISNCSTNGNGTHGINANIGCTIADCTARSNTGDGILCSSECTIRGNTCTQNGFSIGNGAGIHTTSIGNRIEGNHCTVSDRGIDVDDSNNIIIRNTCSGNGINWTIAVGNLYGPIVAPPGGAAVNGSTAPAALGSTDPNANFTY